jgi:hypothetical protein
MDGDKELLITEPFESRGLELIKHEHPEVEAVIDSLKLVIESSKDHPKRPEFIHPTENVMILFGIDEFSAMELIGDINRKGKVERDDEIFVRNHAITPMLLDAITSSTDLRNKERLTISLEVTIEISNDSTIRSYIENNRPALNTLTKNNKKMVRDEHLELNPADKGNIEIHRIVQESVAPNKQANRKNMEPLLIKAHSDKHTSQNETWAERMKDKSSDDSNH